MGKWSDMVSYLKTGGILDLPEFFHIKHGGNMIVIRWANSLLAIVIFSILMSISACSSMPSNKDLGPPSNPQTVQSSVSPNSEERVEIPPGGFHVGDDIFIRKDTIGCVHLSNLLSPMITPPQQNIMEKFFYSAFSGSIARFFGEEPPPQMPYINPQCARLTKKMEFFFYGGLTKTDIQIESKEEKTSVLWVPIRDITIPPPLITNLFTSRVLTCHGTLKADQKIDSCFENIDTLGQSATGPPTTRVSCPQHFKTSNQPAFIYKSWQGSYLKNHIYYQCFPDTFLKTRYHEYLRAWANTGLSRSEQNQWENAGFLPNEAKKWKRAHFSIQQAEEWIGQGVTTPESARKVMANNREKNARINSLCPAGVRKFNIIYTNPYTVQEKCYSFSGRFFQLLGRSKALFFSWPFSKNTVLIDFSPQPVPNGIWFNGIVKGQGVYKYQSAMGVEELVPKLKVIN